MLQSLHLLVVDADRAEALATERSAKWLLPILHMPDNVRSGPVVRRWMDARGIEGELVGQWIGRVAPTLDAVDWLGIVRARSRRLPPHSGTRWTALVSLASSSSWLPYQEWAVRRVTSSATVPVVDGPFGAIGWMDEVVAWAREAIGVDGSNAIETAPALRATAYDAVLRLETRRGAFFFKGLYGARTAEATLTSRLSQIAPRSFARTVAMTTRANGATWWLMDACPGCPLAAAPTPDRALRVATAYAEVQQNILSDRHLLRSRDLPPLPLSEMHRWARNLLLTGEALPASFDREAGARRLEVASDADRDDVERSWILADFDPRNVLLDDDDVRFIDLSDCSLGPAPLGIATLARRLQLAGASIGSELYEAYERSWSPPLEVGERWRAFELVSLLAESYHAWNRVLLKTERGEVHDAIEPARRALARRLAAALQSSPALT
jgi:hypothetical protein